MDKPAIKEHIEFVGPDTAAAELSVMVRKLSATLEVMAELGYRFQMNAFGQDLLEVTDELDLRYPAIELIEVLKITKHYPENASTGISESAIPV